MATDKHVVTGDQYRIIDRRMREIKRQLDQEDGSPLDPEAAAKVLQWVVEGCRGELVIAGGSVKTSDIEEVGLLKSICVGENLTIDPTDGSEILLEADDLFFWIDGHFRNWQADEPSEPTDETPVDVHELKKDAIFAEMFGSFSSDVSTLCLSQSQIKGFCRKYREWLRSDGHGNFFLFRSRDHFFVTHVYVCSGGGLEVHVDRFKNTFVWSAKSRHRVVVPQSA